MTNKAPVTEARSPRDPIAGYVHWVRNVAIPRWAVLGFDADKGRFHERLDLNGRPVSVPHRAMVQARQIYVYADAARRGWYADGAPLAERAMRHVLDEFALRDGRITSVSFSLAEGSTAGSSVRDAYAHAFILFALAALFRLDGNKAWLDEADAVLRFIDSRLTDPVHGGLFDAVPSADGTKRQNPLMHLLESCLFLHQAASDRGYLARADALIDLFNTRLFDRRHDVLLEYFGEDWAPHQDEAKRDAVEPGHHFEWVWLLAEYRRLGGMRSIAFAEPLYAVARAHGVLAGGVIVDELRGVDRSIAKSSHRIWPHTEAIKAAGVRYQAGDHEARGLADAAAGALLAHFLDKPFTGGWIDQLDSMLEPTVSHIPASSLYHLTLAATEADALFANEPLATVAAE
ncbi:mannose-6-phosphate isomerase [Sphingomonas zeicaulis]|uniref:AGE family epimerase/isomerase n=1 Tax=Sphingomonas zeicaulis TaxID=1632740 RepID=UPI003D1B6812